MIIAAGAGYLLGDIMQKAHKDSLEERRFKVLEERLK